MRIVFVINSLIYGGAETQVILFSKALVLRGHAVVIYTLGSENPRASQLAGSGVEVVMDSKRGKLDLFLISRLRRFIREFRADIVQGFLFDGDFYARLAAAGTGIPVLNSERNDNYHVPIRQKLGLTLTRRLVAGVVANTYAGARFAKRLHDLNEEHVHVVWNGIDLAELGHRVKSTDANLNFVFFDKSISKVACLVGMIRPEKDYLLALQVAKELIRISPTWGVLFIGECLPQTSIYKTIIMDAYCRERLDERTVVFGGLRTDVPEIVSCCDVLFSTSLHEGFPNVVLEAMVVGTPVVSTDYSDIRMILPEPWQVVPSRDPVDLASAILRAEQEREFLISSQRAWVEEHATINRAVEQLESIFSRYAASQHS